MNIKTEGWYRVHHWNEAGRFFDLGVQYCRIGPDGWWYSAHKDATHPRYCTRTSGLIKRNSASSDGTFAAVLTALEAAP